MDNFKYKPEIDGLRAVAVIAVILNHISSVVLPGGYLGVDIFFVISGYVITLSLQKMIDISPENLILDFYSRRIKRLVPVLIVVVLVTAVTS